MAKDERKEQALHELAIIKNRAVIAERLATIKAHVTAIEGSLTKGYTIRPSDAKWLESDALQLVLAVETGWRMEYLDWEPTLDGEAPQIPQVIETEQVAWYDEVPYGK